MCLNTISCWFICKSCRCTLNSISSFVNHKEQEHSKVFKKTECIVFEELILEENEDTTSEQALSSTSQACRVEATQVDHIPEEVNITNKIIKTEENNDRDDPLYTADHISDAPTLHKNSSINTDTEPVVDHPFNNRISQKKKVTSVSTILPSIYHAEAGITSTKNPISSKTNSGNENNEIDAHLNPELRPKTELIFNTTIQPLHSDSESKSTSSCVPKLEVLPEIRIIRMISSTAEDSNIKLKSTYHLKNPFVLLEQLTQEEIEAAISRTSTKYKALLLRNGSKQNITKVTKKKSSKSSTKFLQHEERAKSDERSTQENNAQSSDYYSSDAESDLNITFTAPLKIKIGRKHKSQNGPTSTSQISRKNPGSIKQKGKSKKHTLQEQLSSHAKPMCHFCEKSFNSKYARDDHLHKAHLEEPENEKGTLNCVKDAKSAVELSTSQPKKKSEIKFNLNVLPGKESEKSKRTRLEELLYPEVRPACHLCQKSFKNKYALNAHVHITHSTVKKFQCNCGLKYKNRSDLQRHQKNQRLKNINEIGYNSDCFRPSSAPKSSHRSLQTLNSTISEEPKWETANGDLVEDAVYDSLPNLDDQKSSPNSNLSTNSNNVIETHTQANKHASIICKIKNENAVQNGLQKLLSPVTRPTCHLCDKSFKNKIILDSHLRYTHSKVRKYQCHCGKTYKSPSDLQRHQKKQRSKQANDVGYNSDCLKLSVVSSRRRSLPTQTVNSTLDEPKRETCNRDVVEDTVYDSVPNSDDHKPIPNANLNTISNHVVKTHTQAKRPATRPKTKKENTPRTSLQELLSPLIRPICPLCEKSLKNKYALDCHIKFTHSSEKRFKCECGKAYKNRSDLMRHQKQKKEEKLESVA